MVTSTREKQVNPRFSFAAMMRRHSSTEWELRMPNVWVSSNTSVMPKSRIAVSSRITDSTGRVRYGKVPMMQKVQG